jgi:hypothetical protein
MPLARIVLPAGPASTAPMFGCPFPSGLPPATLRPTLRRSIGMPFFITVSASSAHVGVARIVLTSSASVSRASKDA